MTGYKRGSEWRRWDLHLHTPETKKNDNYVGKSVADKWEKFYQKVSDYIGDGSDPVKNIAVIGITDYLSVENYRKVIRDRRMPSTVQLILPNVELRMLPLAAKTPVNIHCLFDPTLIDELDNRFFSKLTFSYCGATYNALNSDLRRLGRDFMGKNKDLSDENAYNKGLEQFVITHGDLQKVFKEDPDLRERTVVVVSNKSKDGASGVTQHQGYKTENGSQMDATRQSIYRMTDLIFSSNPSEVSYFLGGKADNQEKIVERYGALKGCIHGSDAHQYDHVFEPSEKRYCWIKSDPTFNGLKQIIYEPEYRIRISPTKPEEKPAYQVIDSVTFSNPDFQQDPILFNDKLTCIIGGKSTGKSLLLHNMALAVDATQVNDKLAVTGNGYKIVPDIQVKWADGLISKPDNLNEQHKIVYIPQTYLNRLTEKKEEQTEIDRIIHRIIISNSDASAAFDSMKVALKNYKQELDKKIYDCVQNFDNYIEEKEKLSSIGTLEGIQKELQHLRNKQSSLTTNSSLTQEEVDSYDQASSFVTQTTSDIAVIKQEVVVLDKMLEIFQPIEIPIGFSKTVQNQIAGAIERICDQSNLEWIEMKQKIKDGIITKKADLESELTECELTINKIAPKITENEVLKKLAIQIVSEEEKLSEYLEIEEQISALEQQYKQNIAFVINAFDEFKRIRYNYAEAINQNTDLSTDKLVFSVDTPFRSEMFCESLSGMLDKRSVKAQHAWLDIDNFNAEQFVNKENLSKIIDLILTGGLRITKGKTRESALRDIFSDWYNSLYQVTVDNDNIGRMSPGKKSLVLLKLLIHLDEKQCPILIDQPEDDLDNRSVFKELIPFIKRKKIDRQIIIVTHNANVVLGSDAEEVIVANQSGADAPNKKYAFEYRSGSIEDDMPIEVNATDILSKQGIQQHICDILEGGEKAFDLRKNKYRIG